MANRTFHPSRTLPLVVAILAAQAGAMWASTVAGSIDSSTIVAARYFFQILAPLCAYAACWSYAWRCPPKLRLSWILLCFGLLIWVTGMALSAWGEMIGHVSRRVAFISDFVFYFSGAPILLAISLPAEDQRSWLFAGIDAMQVVLAGCLVYIEIFSVVPFASQASVPIPASLLVRTYNIENLVLAAAASVRLLSCSRRSEARIFYWNLSAYLSLYAACAAIYNYLDMRAQNEVGFRDLLIEVPFLSLAVLVMNSASRESKPAPETVRRTQLSLFIETGSPIFFTFALMALGSAIMQMHFRFGMAAIIIALVLYGLRATLLQNRYMRSELALQEARDRLEELSLQDAMTGIANRRRFDQMLEFEWSRATRVRQPLSLLMIDVDFFKSLNDKYGHRSGDECLVQIAHGLRACLPRSGDLLARYGGEEFAVILPSTNRSGAESVAARMQHAVRALNIQNDRTVSAFITISTGVSTYDASASGSPHDLVEASDRALYQAKQNGRNRIEFAEMTPAEETLPAG